MKKLYPVLALVALIAIAAGLCVFIISEKEIAIVTRFGDPTRIIRKAGPHFKLPGFLEKVNRLDRRIRVFKPRPIQLSLKGQKPIIVTCYVCWQIHEPLKFFQSLTTADNARNKLSDMVTSRLGSVLGEYPLENIINTDPSLVKLAEIEGKILSGCNLQARKDYGLKVVDIGIRRITYPTNVTRTVYNRMETDRQKEAKKYRAEGGKEAAKIEASADREVDEILAEANRQAEIIKGEGDREAIKIRGEAARRAPEVFAFLDSLETYKKILGRETTLILSTDSYLFRFLLPEGDIDIVPVETSRPAGGE